MLCLVVALTGSSFPLFNKRPPYSTSAYCNKVLVGNKWSTVLTDDDQWTIRTTQLADIYKQTHGQLPPQRHMHALAWSVISNEGIYMMTIIWHFTETLQRSIWIYANLTLNVWNAMGIITCKMASIAVKAKWRITRTYLSHANGNQIKFLFAFEMLEISDFQYFSSSFQ